MIFNRRIFNLNTGKVSIYDYLDKLISEVDMSTEKMEIDYISSAISIVSSYISSAISSCEFKVYSSDKIKKDSYYYILNYSPNPNETATNLKYNIVKNLIEQGEALCINYNNNLYLAEYFGRAIESINGDEFDGIIIQNTQISNKINKKNALLFKLSDKLPNINLKRFEQTYADIIDSAFTKFKNSSASKWIYRTESFEGNNDETEKKIKEMITAQLKKFINNPKGVLSLNKGQSLERIENDSNKNDTTDIISIRKDCFEMVAIAFKLPISMMYGNVNNLKDVINQFITFSVKPIAKMISEEMTRVFFSQAEINAGSRVEVDISKISYRDIFDVAEKCDKLIASSVADIDEARVLINLPPLNTKWSKQHWLTKNYTKIENAMQNLENEKGGDADDEG